MKDRSKFESYIYKIIKSLSGNRVANSAINLFPNSFKLWLLSKFIYSANNSSIYKNIELPKIKKQFLLDKWGNSKYRNFGPAGGQIPSNTKILIAVGALSVSGGTNVIFEYAHALKTSGATVFIGYLRGQSNDADWHHLSAQFEIKHLSKYKSLKFDLGIMTWWKTVEPMLKMQCAKYLYFVQSLESRFAINSQDRNEEIAAASTYLLNIPMVTVAIWLQNLLICVSGTPTWRVQNGIDKTNFPVCEPKDLYLPQTSSEIRYLVEGTFGIPMKAVAETLQVCTDLELKSVTYINPSLTNPGFHNVKVLNRISISKMYEIYRDHDVLIKMSRVEALALPPIEAFHAGCTAIISKVTGSEEYIRDGINALYVEVDDFSNLKEVIMNLESNPSVIAKLKMGAISTASKWPDIKSAGAEFASICYSILASESLGNRPIGDPEILLRQVRSKVENSEFLSRLLLNFTNQ